MQKPRVPEEERLNFVEKLNHIKMQCLLTDIIQARQISDSVSKEEVNIFCSQFSEIVNESANSCNDNNNTNTTKCHGLDASVKYHVKNITAQRKGMHPLLQRHTW